MKLGELLTLNDAIKAIDQAGIAGDVVECGTYNGGSAALIAFCSDKKIKRNFWLFDSFEGLPPPTEEDSQVVIAKYYKGWCKAEVAFVKEVFQKIYFPLERVKIFEGWFSDTFSKANVESVALLHIDADLYESVKICLETFYPRVASGGVIVFDDYGYWEGCKKAVDEYLAKFAPSTELKTDNGINFYFKKA